MSILSMVKNVVSTCLGGSTIKIVILTIVSVLGVLYGTYNYGYKSGVNEVSQTIVAERVIWEDKVKETETKFNEYKVNLEAQHKTEVKEYEKQIATLRDNPKIVTKYVTKEVQVPCTFELLHNRLVDGTPINTMIPAGYSCPKDHSLTDVSNVLITNYSNCRLAMERLEALQKIVKDYQAKQNALTEETK